MVSIIRIARGKESVVESGSRSKMNDRLKQLQKSTRGGASGQGGKKYSVKYELREFESKKKPPYITTTHGMRGPFAVMVDGETGEPIQSSPINCKNPQEAVADAKYWAECEELEYKP